MRLTLLPAILGCFLVSCSAPGGLPLPEVAAEINATLAPVDYAIAPGDIVSVSFPHDTTWNHDRVVQPDGKASFLFVGSVSVAGMTPAQLEERLHRDYQDVLTGAIDVTVSLQTLGTRSVTVLGEVQRPGVYPISDQRGEHTTLLEALALAGGPERGRAHMGSLVLVRWDAGRQQQIAWTIDAREKHWASKAPILVQDNDLVIVPPTNVYKVNIWVDNYLRQMLPFPQFIIPAR